MIKAALIGNPNCGKTTIFNALTGTQQRVGNWPGVTVEKKTGNFIDPATRNSVELTDLPGVYSLTQVNGGLDEQITRDFLTSEAVDLVINIIDAASLSRGLFLTSELQALGVPCVVAVNMIDVAAQEGIEINIKALKAQLGCPVVALIASKRNGMAELKNDLHNASVLKQFATGETVSRFKDIDRVVTDCVEHLPTALQSRTWTERIDTLALNRYAAFPFFLSVMYLMFLISINLGSAFIDFFDLVGSVLFVEGPRQLMQAIGTPAWLEIFLADGVGGGVQLVGTFIPVIGALFFGIGLSRRLRLHGTRRLHRRPSAAKPRAARQSFCSADCRIWLQRTRRDGNTGVRFTARPHSHNPHGPLYELRCTPNRVRAICSGILSKKWPERCFCALSHRHCCCRFKCINRT